MSRHRLSLSADQVRLIDVAAATLRIDGRDRFKHDVIRTLELGCGLRAVSNDEVAKAITDCIGITATTHVFLTDSAPGQQQNKE